MPDMKPKPDNVEGPVLPNPKTDVAAAQAEVVESGEHEMITPPKEVMGKMLKSWYSRECECVPQNWFEHPAAPKKRIVKDFKELKPIAETKSISQPAAGPKEPKDATFLINPDKIKMVQSIVTVDRNSQQMSVDVKQLQAIEAKGPSALDAIGAEQDATDYRPLEVFVAVGKQDLNFLARLAFDMRNRALQAEHDLDLATKPAVETKETQAAPAGGMLRRRRLSA